MRTHLFIPLLSIAFITACSGPSTKTQHTETADTLSAPVHAHDEVSSEAVTPVSIEGLELNNGHKWKADASTNENVKHILTVVKEIKSEPGKTLDTYHLGTDKLLQATNKLIGDCKMQGPDHEALHKWLLPLLDKIKAMGNTLNLADAEKAFADIENHLNAYTNYFE